MSITFYMFGEDVGTIPCGFGASILNHSIIITLDAEHYLMILADFSNLNQQ
jgi:hypothetical protein